jgi:lipopolysaccharide transport system permease protein
MSYPTVVKPPSKIEFPDIKGIWEYRDLLYFLVLSNLKTRFKQTFIGVFWIILQPIIQMAIFYVILGVLVKVPTGDVPYHVFYLSGFVVWQVFNQIVNSSAHSLVGNIGIITKTYFPRLVLPLSSTIGVVIDFMISFSVLIFFLQISGYSINFRYGLLPLLLLITLIFSMGVGLLFGAFMVVFRDIRNLLSFVLQIWMFISPIIYPVSIVPDRYKFLVYLNPLTGLIGAYRWVVLRTDTLPSLSNLALSSLVAVVLWIVGMIAFRSMETHMVDVL